MGYRISYGQTKAETYHRRKINLALPLCALLVIGIVAAGMVFPQVGEVLRGLLFPVTDEATVTAFQDMVQQVGEGVSVGEAVTAFCREIVENAQNLP